MTEDDLRRAIALGREQRSTEFKGPGERSNSAFCVKVVRAVLGMANTPDGGTVVIGVDDDGARLSPTGLSEVQLQTWKYDDFASTLSNYADPYADFDIGTITMDGKSYVAIDVRPFDRVPVLCKKEYSGVLRKGALYVRRRGRNETVEVPSHSEMREVLQRAAEFIAREMVAAHQMLTAHSVSIGSIGSTASSATPYDEEAGDLL